MQIPPGKHDIDPADHVDQGPAGPEISGSSNGGLTCPTCAFF